MVTPQVRTSSDRSLPPGRQPLEALLYRLNDLIFPEDLPAGASKMIFSGDELAAAGIDVNLWLSQLSKLG